MSDQPTPASPPTDPAAGLDPAALLQRGISTTPPVKRPPPPTPGELEAQLPELAVHELIGQGGMGAVFRATQRNLDRPVALKVMARELGADPAFAARFVREAKAMARLTHPGIVAVHDFGQRGDLCWLVMELVEGANLREVMRTGRLSPAQALAIVPQLCDALQYAHDVGVIHRDIKPENILLDQRGRVKITDFGLAKVPESDRPLGEALTASGDRLGTVHYMAPEQVEGAKSVDHRADIYSLGVVFYEMLTGGLPLGRFEPPSRRIAVDVQIDEVVLKALEKDPQRRWQQASEVQRAVAVGTPVAVVAEAERTKPTFSRRDRRGFILGLIIAISVGIFTFAWSLLQETTAQSESPRSEPAAIRRLIEIGRFPEAREAILRLVQQDPGQSVRELQRDLDLAEARFLWRSGDLEKSGEAYRQALARHHGDQSVAQAMIADLPSTEPYAVDAVVELTQLSTPKEIEVAWRALRLRHGDPESFRSIVAMLARAPGTAIEARTHLGSDEAGVRWQALQVLEKAGVVTDADLIRFHTGNFLNGGYLVVKSGKDASPGISWDESVAWLMTAATAADWPARKSAAVLPDFYHLGWYLSRAEREEGDAIERLLLVAFPEQTLRQLDAWMAIPREGKDVPAAFMERLVHMRERLSAH